eukprot:s922_g7.t1
MKRGTGVEVGCQRALEKPMTDLEENLKGFLKEVLSAESEMRKLQNEAHEAKSNLAQCKQELEQTRTKFATEESIECLGTPQHRSFHKSRLAPAMAVGKGKGGKGGKGGHAGQQVRKTAVKQSAPSRAPPATVKIRKKVNWLNREGYFGKQFVDEDALEMLGTLPEDRAMSVLENLEGKAEYGEIWNPNSYVVKAVIRHSQQLNAEPQWSPSSTVRSGPPAALPVLKKVNWLNREGFFGEAEIDEDAVEMLGGLPIDRAMSILENIEDPDKGEESQDQQLPQNDPCSDNGEASDPDIAADDDQDMADDPDQEEDEFQEEQEKEKELEEITE